MIDKPRRLGVAFTLPPEVIGKTLIGLSVLVNFKRDPNISSPPCDPILERYSAQRPMVSHTRGQQNDGCQYLVATYLSTIRLGMRHFAYKPQIERRQINCGSSPETFRTTAAASAALANMWLAVHVAVLASSNRSSANCASSIMCWWKTCCKTAGSCETDPIMLNLIAMAREDSIVLDVP